MVRSTSRIWGVRSALKHAIDMIRSRPPHFLVVFAARQVLDGAEDVYECYPEEATGIIAEAERIMRAEAARDFHAPDEAAADWVAGLVRIMRTGRSPYKENAASKLFRNRDLVKDVRPADGDEIVLEAARLSHAAALRECNRRRLPVPPRLLLPAAPGQGAC
jgi:hypothetical protein